MALVSPWRGHFTPCVWPTLRDMTSRPAPDSSLVARFVSSPNYGERRGYRAPDCLILHYTGMPTGEAALKALTDPASEVSAHYLVWEDGSIDQLVAERDRAWHAGRGSWKGEADLNSASIGIEIVNPGHDGGSPPFPDRQIEATIALVRDIAARWEIAPNGLSPIPTSRRRASAIRGKFYSGTRSGGAALAIGPSLRRYPAPRSSPPEEIGRRCKRCRRCSPLYGYGAEITGIYDRQTRQVVTAFPAPLPRRRVDGEADASTLATLKALIDGLGGAEPSTRA